MTKCDDGEGVWKMTNNPLSNALGVPHLRITNLFVTLPLVLQTTMYFNRLIKHVPCDDERPLCDNSSHQVIANLQHCNVRRYSLIVNHSTDRRIWLDE